MMGNQNDKKNRICERPKNHKVQLESSTRNGRTNGRMRTVSKRTGERENSAFVLRRDREPLPGMLLDGQTLKGHM